MIYSVVLYKILNGSDHEVMVNCSMTSGVAYVLAHPAQIIRQIEAEWRDRAKTQYREIGLDYLLLDPSAISLDHNPQNIHRWGILPDEYEVLSLAVYGHTKMTVARCTGPQAVSFWEKGYKPKLPKEFET